MNKKTMWKTAVIIIFLLMLAGEAYTLSAVVSLDMLPAGYMAVFVSILILFSATVGMMLFFKGKKPGKTRKIIACVLAVLVICGCAAIGTVASDVMKTLKATTTELLEIPTREVYVLADNPVEDLKDTRGYTYGYLKYYDENCTNQALGTVSQKTDNRVSTAGYTDIVTMVRALLDNRLDAIILNGGIVSILEEAEEFADFSMRTKVLDQIRVQEAENLEDVVISGQEETIPDNTVQETESTEPVQEIEDFTTLKPFVVYVSGSDSHNTQIVKNGRSDVNILAVVNPMTKQVLLVNTPRDYYVANTAGGGAYDKLTHCGIYGIKCSMNTLGRLYDVDVDYYVRINFTGFKKLIDAMGGVRVYSDYAFMAITRTPIQEGWNDLNGQQALDFARERVKVKGGDNERGRHQMQVITALIEKATSGTTIITNYSDIMASVEGMFQMSVPTELISSLMKMQLSDMAKWNVVSVAATGGGASAVCYSMPGVELSVIMPNRSSVSRASRLIHMVLDGELLTEEVMSSI